MKKTTLLLSILFLLLFNLQSYSQITPTNLKCEYIQNPIGIDEHSPRFTWQIKSKEQGVFQKAYQIVVGTIPEKVSAGRGDIWDSGTVNSSFIPAIYQGPYLQPFTRYF